MTAPELGAAAIRAALERAGVPADAVQEVFMGNVVSANVGQAPATQAARLAGIPSNVPCTTINKVCASGMKAVMCAAQSIRLGDADVVVAGGMESMSNIPHYVPKSRGGTRLGHFEVVDGMIRDGLWDPNINVHMGSCAELCAEQLGITRQQQDDHAYTSYQRAQSALASGWTAREIVAVEVAGRRGRPPTVVTTDETLAKMDAVKLRTLEPYFKKGTGTVTAGNASPISDGAAALLLSSARRASELGVAPLAVVRSYADANQEPEWFSTTPALAVPKALQRAGLDISQVDLWEINEAFSVVDLANQQLLGLDPDRVNVHGGAVALGHPIGASGARVIVTLLNAMRAHGGRVGCATICNGGGGASAIVIESLHTPNM